MNEDVKSNNALIDIELSEEDAKVLKESLNNWKEETYADLLESVEQAKQEKLEELEELNVQFQESLKEEASNKLLEALSEMRDQIKAEVFAESIANNPEAQILEEIKKLIAPTLNEDYFSSQYAEEIKELIAENEALKEEKAINEGAETLADLIRDFDGKTQNLIMNLIKPGDSESVTEQFYELQESLQEAEASDEDYEDDEEDYEDDEDEYEDDFEEDYEDDFEDDEIGESFTDEDIIDGDDSLSEEEDSNLKKTISKLANM